MSARFGGVFKIVAADEAKEKEGEKDTARTSFQGLLRFPLTSPVHLYLRSATHYSRTK